MHYRFHANVFAHPADAAEGATIELRDITLPTICGAEGRPLTFTSFLPVSFEEAFDALARLPRLDAEPDGFFVFAGGRAPARWQVDGHLFDFGAGLHRVELHGACPPESFDELVACFGWPQAELAFELVREGVVLNEAAFRTWAAA